MSVNLNSRWAVLDTETTGFSARNDRVISLAVITLDQNLEVEETWSTFLNPGVPTGAVDVHGITEGMLIGAPRFDEVFSKLDAMLTGRVMVAHNASFDHGFLSAEAERLGRNLSHTSALCTLRAARRVGPKLPSLSLGSLARAYSIEQARAHDALDDTRVLVEIFKRLHAEASRAGTKLYALGERGESGYVKKPQKTACLFQNPGKLICGERLKQGMRVAFTGGDEAEREDLEAKITKLGLDVSGSVSSKTSLLVSDGYPGAKTRKADEVGCPTLSYHQFKALLSQGVSPGVLA